MKYKNSDFLSENLRLRRMPQSAEQAYNKIVCLCENEQRRHPNANRLYGAPLSKRRERLVKMYWAFQRTEQNRKS